jgi:tRNA-specific 2-thiouridylase
METTGKHIFVGLSGGVDSAVAAALLLRDGHRVTGVYMKNWSDEAADQAGEECGWRQERRDAMRVAAHLGIPFLTYDLEAEYRERVFAYLVREYAEGRTPNPDVLCNNLVKFDAFLERAKADGADMIATGHYARVRKTGEAYQLLAGADLNKDQSYFLHRLDQEQLSRALFPIGHLEKPEVRRLAREFGLPNAEKKDSQGLCFIGKVDMRTFLEPHVSQAPGPIVEPDGKEIGRHAGMAAYTIGQRHGLGLGGGEPAYVVGKQMATNTLVVARGEDPEALYRDVVMLDDMHWIAGAAPEAPFTCQARIRYRQPLQDTRVQWSDDGYDLVFTERQRAVTPGQFAVLYDGDVCLGGGVIA